MDLLQSNSNSTFSDEVRMKKQQVKDQDLDDTCSLTASDFEVLNSENFFDKINDAFQATSLNRNSIHDTKQSRNHSNKNHEDFSKNNIA
jgi:hypothetical protein